MEKQPIDSGIIARLTGALKSFVGTIDNGNQWFGPLNPPSPTVSGDQKEGVIGRQFDFPVGVNLRMTPRQGESVTFSQMRALADNCNILRLVIETRKDQISRLRFIIKPADKSLKPDPRCKEVEDFFKLPDGENTWNTWLRQLLEEMLVVDAATIYPWTTNNNKPYRFELVDGSTIKRVLDSRGRTPAPPEPAYQQVLKGFPAINYTSDELIYAPRNKRVHKIYGFGPVEQIIMTINIAMRRSMHHLQYYTEGSVPDLLFQVPADWNMSQIKDFNDWWQDTLSGNTAARRKAQFVPNGVSPINTKEMVLKDPIDEWLARIICYAFNVSAQPFIREINRSTAETSYQMALEEGLHPLLSWVKDLMDHLIWKYFGYKDLEFSWVDGKEMDVNAQEVIYDRSLRNGSMTLNEVRSRRGEDPYDAPFASIPMVLTANGYIEIAPVVSVDNITSDSLKVDKQLRSSEVFKSRNVKRINRQRPFILKQERAIMKKVSALFKEQANALSGYVVSKISKGTEFSLDNYDFNWDGFEELMMGTLPLITSSGVEAAYMQLSLDDKQMLELANKDAIEWARARAAELVGKRITKDGQIIDNPDAEYIIDKTTRELLNADVVTAMEQGLSNDDLSEMLKNNYAFSENRAETIARTETALADCNGNRVLYQQSGNVASKKWIVGDGCCEECQKLEGEIVGFDEKFSNDIDIPPAHPNCRCDFIPILTEQSEE